MGINIGSGMRLNDNMVPLTNCEMTVKNVKKPNKEWMS
jgi:hypothetical protein